MKKLIIITNIKITLEESDYVVPMIDADQPEIMRVYLRSLLSTRGNLTGELHAIDVDDSNITEVIKASYPTHIIDRTLADYLYSLQPDENNIIAHVTSIDYDSTAYIILDSDEYIEDYLELHDNDEDTIVYNLLLEYCRLAVNYTIV